MAGSPRVEITPEILLRAYAAGIFPMAEDAEDPSLFWVEPRARGIVPLDGVMSRAPGPHGPAGRVRDQDRQSISRRDRRLRRAGR
jgi:hypothetical protein